MTPGRNPSISASARSISRSTAATAVRVLQIDRDVAAAALQQREARVLALAADVAPDIGGAIDPDHLGAHVGQQHRAERRRADAGQFDDPDPFKRSHGFLSSSCCPQPASTSLRRHCEERSDEAISTADEWKCSSLGPA